MKKFDSKLFDDYIEEISKLAKNSDKNYKSKIVELVQLIKKFNNNNSLALPILNYILENTIQLSEDEDKIGIKSNLENLKFIVFDLISLKLIIFNT